VADGELASLVLRPVRRDRVLTADRGHDQTSG